MNKGTIGAGGGAPLIDPRTHPEWDGWLRRLQAGAAPFALLSEVLEWVRRQTAAQTAFLLLPVRGGQEVHFALVSGQGMEELHGLRLRPDETVLDELLQKRVVWHYYDEGEQEPHSRGVRRGFKGLRSGVGVPLPGLPGGALVLVNRRQQERFTAEHEALLTQLTPLFTMGIYLHTLKQSLEQRDHALEWLRQLPEPLSEEVSLPHVLTVVEPILRAASPLAGGLWLYNEEHTRLLCTLKYGVSLLPEAVDPTTLPPHWQETPCTIATEHGLSARLFPLRLAGRPLGLLVLGMREQDEESATPLAMPIDVLVGHMALLVGHALLYEQLARRAQHLTTLYEFSLRLGEVHTVEQWLGLVAKSAIRLVPADYCVIYFASAQSPADDPARLQPVCVSPPHDALQLHYPDAQYSLPGWVYAFNAPLSAPDLVHHPQNLKEPLPSMFRSALAVPLQVAEQAFGVLILLTLEPREFTLAEVEALFMLANFGALRLHALEKPAYA